MFSVSFFKALMFTIVNISSILKIVYRCRHKIQLQLGGIIMIRIIILCLGVALIVFIAWWFFGKHNVATENASVNSNKQSVDIVVKGGYSPEKVILERGIPATLNFKRTDSSSCLDHVIFSDFGINQKLPQGKTEPIKIDTSKPGEYEWACSMNMFHGKVIVK